MDDTISRERRQVERQAYTFYLDPTLVARARTEIEEREVVRSIEAALAAALDYQMWVREVSAGRREQLNRREGGAAPPSRAEPVAAPRGG